MYCGLSGVDEYPNLNLIGNARIDSGMYDPVPAHTGRRGRPAKHGKHLSVETDFAFPGRLADFLCLAGKRTILV